MAKRKTTEEKLQEEMLNYYKKQNERLRLKEQQELIEQERLLEEQKEQEKKTKELQNMGKKLKKIKDKKLIETISSIIIKTWEEIEEIPRNPDNFDVLSVLEVQEWFLNKGIDISALGLTRSLMFDFSRKEIYDYFDEYGLSEKIRWNKLIIKIRQKLKSWIDKKERDEFEDKVNSLVKRAREDNLFSVTTSHIKQFASELGIDTTRQMNLLTNAVTTKLNKEFGGNEPKKKRTLTKSIKLEVFKRDNYTCQECGAGREAKLHVHHIIPVSCGGSDEMSNLITLCDSCNRAIGNRIYKMKPKK